MAGWVESPVESAQSGEIRLVGDYEWVVNSDLIIGHWLRKLPFGRLEMSGWHMDFSHDRGQTEHGGVKVENHLLG